MVSGKYSSRMGSRSACFYLAALVFACLVQLSYAKVHHPFPMPLCHGFKLEEATVDQIQARLMSGKLTSVQLVQCYVEVRIRRFVFYSANMRMLVLKLLNRLLNQQRINQLNPYLKYVV